MESPIAKDFRVSYAPEKQQAHMTLDDHPITLSFQSEDPENSIWHLIFSAMEDEMKQGNKSNS